MLAVALGYVLEWGFFSFLYEREHLQQVLMTYGLILVFEELRSLLVGDDVHGVKPPESWLAGTLPLGDVMTYPVYRLFISAVCLALAAGMYFVLHAHAAGHDDPRRREQPRDGAVPGHRHPVPLPRGVRRRRGAGGVRRHDRRAGDHRSTRAWAAQVLIISFVVVVIGGIGSVRGALLAALLIGVVDTFGKVLFPQAAGVLVYVLMALILLWKPDGLFKAG